MNRAKQMSESIELGIVLAMAGGLMDACSYLGRGGVFANAQTGNMLLLGVNLSEGRFEEALHYLFPVVSFAIGIALADLVRVGPGKKSSLHWRQLSVLVEALVLTAVSFFPQEFNTAANSLTSLACGIQVESFRKIRGNGIATTMCIGNLRSGTQNLCEYFRNRSNREAASKGLLYYGIIVCFIIGAVIGNICVRLFAERAILASAALLLLAFVMMFVDRERAEQNFT